jgi:predicted site-specific integrase-resolvase
VTAVAGAGLLVNSQVAGRFNVCAKTVSRWGKSGRLLAVRYGGGHYLFFEAEVAALIAGASREKARELAEAEHARLSQGPVR